MKCECKDCGEVWKRKKIQLPEKCPECKSFCWEVGYNSTCQACDRIIFRPILHHINGNHDDNSKNNRFWVCLKCHNIIHHGFNSIDFNINDELKWINTVDLVYNEKKAKGLKRLIILRAKLQQKI